MIFYLTARIGFNLIRAVKIFLSSSRDFEKKCRAVEIRADAFRAIHPDSKKRVKLFAAFVKGGLERVLVLKHNTLKYKLGGFLD